MIYDTNTSLMAKSKELEDTNTSLVASRETLKQLEEDCQLTDTQFVTRQAEREEEITAVAKALQILSDDDAHDTFSRTFMPSFFQVAATRHRDARGRASTLLC